MTETAPETALALMANADAVYMAIGWFVGTAAMMVFMAGVVIAAIVAPFLAFLFLEMADDADKLRRIPEDELTRFHRAQMLQAGDYTANLYSAAICFVVTAVSWWLVYLKVVQVFS